MRQAIVHVALVIRDYDEAIEFFRICERAQKTGIWHGGRI